MRCLGGNLIEPRALLGRRVIRPQPHAKLHIEDIGAAEAVRRVLEHERPVRHNALRLDELVVQHELLSVRRLGRGLGQRGGAGFVKDGRLRFGEGERAEEGGHQVREGGVVRGGVFVEGDFGRGAWLDEEFAGGICEGSIAAWVSEFVRAGDERWARRITYCPATAWSNPTRSPMSGSTLLIMLFFRSSL